MMDRRKFLGTGAATLASLAIPKLLQAQDCDNGTLKDIYGEGPFHAANAPQRVQLAQDFEPGQRLAVQGTVTSCNGPLAGVNLDLWHATDSGCYQHPADTCPEIPGHPQTFRLRGQVVTDAEGKYSFATILPGAYLNGAKYRPSHIHAIISHTIIRNEPIVTQLYFEGDPHIRGDIAADDPSAANRIIPLLKNSVSPWQGTWNIRIPKATTGLYSLSDPDLGHFDVVTQRRGGLILFHLPPNTSRQPVELRLFDMRGALVSKSLHNKAPVELRAADLRPGAYMVELAWPTRHGLRKESVPVRI